MITGIEVKRKLVHLATLVIPVGYGFTSDTTVLTFLVPFFLLYLLVDLVRHYHPGLASLFQKHFFGRVLREREKPTLMGSTYFLFASIMTILLFPKPIAIVSLLILILSDTAAALVGRGFGRTPIFNKTLEGSLAFLMTSFLIVWIYPGLDRLAGSIAAVGTTLVEVLPLPLDDNFTIPLVAGIILSFGMG